MKCFPNVLLVGSTSKNAGKTLVTEKLINTVHSSTKVNLIHFPNRPSLTNINTTSDLKDYLTAEDRYV